MTRGSLRTEAEWRELGKSVYRELALAGPLGLSKLELIDRAWLRDDEILADVVWWLRGHGVDVRWVRGRYVLGARLPRAWEERLDE